MDASLIEARRVAIVGRLRSITKRDAQQLIRDCGGTYCEKLESRLGRVELVILGEFDDAEAPLALQSCLDDPKVEVIDESELCKRLDHNEQGPTIRRLYTIGMLAESLEIPDSVIRRWFRNQVLVPEKEIHGIPYFALPEVATAERLAELFRAGATPRAIEQMLVKLGTRAEELNQSLTELEIVVDGKQMLIRRGEELLESTGQLRIDFDALDEVEEQHPVVSIKLEDAIRGESSSDFIAPGELLSEAMRLEDEGHLEEASEYYRASLAAAGPSAEVCFQLAGVLYRLGDMAAARERYFMAVELDENFVEARASLGCVLAEMGQLTLAIAAFQGALLHHSDYPDVHYHLARALDQSGERKSAEYHWQRFLELAPASPWADEARTRMQSACEPFLPDLF